jgi:hypothetical protein
VLLGYYGRRKLLLVVSGWMKRSGYEKLVPVVEWV